MFGLFRRSNPEVVVSYLFAVIRANLEATNEELIRDGVIVKPIEAREIPGGVGCRLVVGYNGGQPLVGC